MDMSSIAPSFDLRSPGPHGLPVLGSWDGYPSFFNCTTTTTPSCRKSNWNLSARLIGGLLCGTPAAPGDTIQAQLPVQAAPVIQQQVTASLTLTIPQKLEALRETFTLSTSALAEVLGVSRPTIYQWIKGQSEPQSIDSRNRLDQLVLLAKAWNDAFPGRSMDHWLTDNEPGQPSLLELLKAPQHDAAQIRALLDQRIGQASQAANRIASERQAVGDTALPTRVSNVPEPLRRWSVARSALLRASNLRP